MDPDQLYQEDQEGLDVETAKEKDRHNSGYLNTYYTRQTFDDLYNDTDKVADKNEHYGEFVTYVISVSHHVSDYVAIDLRVPYIDAEMDAHFGARDTDESGWGDITIGGSFDLWRPKDRGDDHECGPLDLCNLTIMASVKLPTGDETERPLVSDSRFAQTGSGTTAINLGLQYNTRVASDLGLFGSINYTNTLTETNYDAEPGDVWFISLGTNYAGWAKSIGLTLFLSVDYTYQDNWEGSSFAGGGGSTGSNTVSTTPGLFWEFLENSFLNVSVAIPLWRKVNGNQLVGDPLYSFGVVYRY